MLKISNLGKGPENEVGFALAVVTGGTWVGIDHAQTKSMN